MVSTFHKISQNISHSDFRVRLFGPNGSGRVGQYVSYYVTFYYAKFVMYNAKIIPSIFVYYFLWWLSVDCSISKRAHFIQHTAYIANIQQEISVFFFRQFKWKKKKKCLVTFSAHKQFTTCMIIQAIFCCLFLSTLKRPN